MKPISVIDPGAAISASAALRSLIDDPNGDYQRWRRHEVPFPAMCRAVVQALAGELPSEDDPNVPTRLPRLPRT